MKVLGKEFYHRDCLNVAPELVGKILCHKTENEVVKLRITETESYRGEEDKGCHASKGRTKRTELLYHESGTIYIYLCYGMHWLFNVVTGEKDFPEAVLIRCCKDYEGPGMLTKKLEIEGSLNGKSIVGNEEIWVEDDGYCPEIVTDVRVGIDYAGEEWKMKLWRFVDRAKRLTK